MKKEKKSTSNAKLHGIDLKRFPGDIVIKWVTTGYQTSERICVSGYLNKMQELTQHKISAPCHPSPAPTHKEDL